MSISITPLTGCVGAEIGGIDLKKNIDASAFNILHKAFLEHCMLVFRGQHIDSQSLNDFGARWGKPELASSLTPGIPGFPAIIEVKDIPKAMASTEAWHFDSPYVDIPPKISILSAVTIPRGGDTMWCNQQESYDRLSETMKKALTGLRVRFQGLRLARMRGITDDAKIPRAVHPLVRTHPETGRKALYVGHPETAYLIDGMTHEESQPLLSFLYQHSIAPDNIYRHMWQVGDVVMWDNRCTMHYAVHDYGTQDRVLQRITMSGERPA